MVTYEDPAASPSAPPIGQRPAARQGHAWGAPPPAWATSTATDRRRPLISSEWHENGEIDEGRVDVYHGSAAGLPAQPDWCAESDAPGAYFGYSASTAGDIDGDGYADVIIAAPWYATGQVDEGCADLYLGPPGGLAERGWTWKATQDGPGSPRQRGGDVNDDGYSDVLVGVPRDDSGQVDEGKVFLFLDGSRAGQCARLGRRVRSGWRAVRAHQHGRRRQRRRLRRRDRAACGATITAKPTKAAHSVSGSG